MKRMPVITLILLGIAFVFPAHGTCGSQSRTAHGIADDTLSRSLDGLIKEVYSIVSGEAGQDRNWKRFSSLFHPSAQLISIRRRGGDTVATRVMTVQEFIERAAESSKRYAFTQYEIQRGVESFGDMAHVWSTYQATADSPDGRRSWRGINSFQLYRDGNRYLILSIAWEDEAPGLTIPDPILRLPKH